MTGPHTRTHTAGQPGPHTLDIHVSNATVRVLAEPRTHAEVTLTGTLDDSTIRETAGRLTVLVPDDVSERAGTAGPGGFINAGVIATGGGTVTVHGSVIGGGATTTGTAGTGPAVTVEARLPEGSSLVVH